MEALISQEEEALKAELREARERVESLVGKLHSVDGELEALSVEQERYGLLSTACGALEGLRAQGAAGLFWGEGEGDGSDQLRQARGRVAAFEKRLEQTEGRRQEVLEQIEVHEESAEFIAADVLHARWEQEQRKLEWITEREIGPAPSTPTVMPWSRGGEDDERLRKSLLASLLVSMLLGLLLPLIELPLPVAGEPVEVPERLARLIREERALPPPPPVAQQAKPTDETKPSEDQAPEQLVPEAAKPDAKSKGILAFREQFSALAAAAPDARLGAKAKISSAGEMGSARPERSMVTTQGPSSSGGINLASLSRDVGGAGGEGIAGVSVTQATSTIGGLGGGSGRPLSNGPGPSRTDEEIQIVFDRHKSALYRLYNRELRRNPTLQGQMVLRLTIEPDGSVSLCELQSTDMKAPKLSAQVVERVKTFDFGAKEGIPPVTIVYPIDFLPAA